MEEGTLKNKIARAVIRVPDINPKTDQVYTHEVAFTRRPGWSAQKKYETALPGGKMEVQDFIGIVFQKQLDDPEFVPSEEQMIAAAKKTVERELREELGQALMDELGLLAIGLMFIDKKSDRNGYTNYSFAADLQRKPTVDVKPNSAGSIWLPEERLETKRVPLLSGHLGIVRRGLERLRDNAT